MTSNTFEGLLAAVARIEASQQCIDQTIESIIRNELAKNNDTCMFARIGDFIARATWALSQLSDRLINGEHIEDDADDRVAEMDYEDGFSDPDYLYYMRDKHAVLRKLNSRIQDAAAEVTATWNRSPRARQMPPRRALAQSSSPPIIPVAVRSPTIKTWDHKTVSMVNEYTTIGTPKTKVEPDSDHEDLKSGLRSDRLEDDSQGVINELIATLSGRGKGNHICPLGRECRKKGLDADGNPKVFPRNSAFRAHLEKHGKMYKCDIPGCKNKEGFARKDQLQRHQQETVFHTKLGR